MSARAQTVRLTPAQHRTLGGFAKTYGLSEYAMLARVVDAGLAALVHGADSGIDAREIVAELASVNTSIVDVERSEEHTSELQSLMRISYAVFCLKKKKK